MTAYEMMLSESQERMLMVLRPEKEAEARAVFEKWDLDFAIVGETIPEDRFLILHGNEVKADLPLATLAGSAPEYDRPWVPTPAAAPLGDVPGIDPIDGLQALIGSPNYAAKHWVWEQYDTQVGGDTVRSAGPGSGVVRVHGTDKALAFTSDVTPRYVEANPVEGGKQAVAEAWRNLIAVGARPACGHRQPEFRQPRKARDHGPVRRRHRRHRRGLPGARHADRVGQRVALQRDRRHGHPAHADHRRGRPDRHARSGDRRHRPRRAGSRWCWARPVAIWANRRCWPRSLAAPRAMRPRSIWPRSGATGDFIRANHALIGACTDLSDGGLALAAFEMAEAAGIGVALDAGDTATLFGEDQARYLIACPLADAKALTAAAAEAGLHLTEVGAFGGDAVRMGGASASLAELSALYRSAFAAAVA